MVMVWGISFIASLFHLGMILFFAPWIMSLENWFEAKIQGLPATPLWIHKTEIYSPNINQFSNAIRDSAFVGFLSKIVFSIVVIAAALIPSFTTGMLTSKISDLFLIMILLMIVPLLFFLMYLEQKDIFPLERKYRFIIQSLFALPALFFVIIVVRSTTETINFDDIITYFHQTNNIPLSACAPVMLSACSLFLLIWEIPTFFHKEALSGFGGKYRGLLLYANDIQFVVWLSIIGALIWPQTLAHLTSNGIGIWVTNIPWGVLGWWIKIISASFILALLRSTFLFSSVSRRFGLATLLSFMALIICLASFSGE